MCWIAAHAQHILSSQRPANEFGRHIVKSSSLRIFSYFSWTVPCYICRRCGERGWKWESVEISLTVGSIQLRARGGRVTWCAGRGGELATSSATSDTGSRLWQLSRGHSSSWCSGWVSQYNVAKPRVCWELFRLNRTGRTVLYIILNCRCYLFLCIVNITIPRIYINVV